MTEKVSLKRYELFGLYNALKALDGQPTVINDNDGKFQGIINKPYKFKDAKAIYAIARTRKALEPEIMAVEEAQKVIKDNLPKEASAKDIEQANTSITTLMRDVISIDVHKLDAKSLNLSENLLSPGIISDLLPMLIIAD